MTQLMFLPNKGTKEDRAGFSREGGRGVTKGGGWVGGVLASGGVKLAERGHVRRCGERRCGERQRRESALSAQRAAKQMLALLDSCGSKGTN